MADITTYLKQILNAVYGKDVRQAIHDAIHKCYEDGSAGEIDLVAREQIAGLSNPNLLINSDFRNPVNQRKITKYEGGATKGYTVDRWCMGENDFGRTVEIVDGGVKITNPNTTYNGTFQQIFEKTLKGTYTVSIKVSALNGSGIIYCGGNQADTKKNLLLGITTFTIDNATIDSVVVQVGPSSNLTVEWIKLEQGTMATPLAPRLYVEELMLCQRYYTRLSTTYGMMVTQRASADKTTYIFVPTPQSLRDAPTIEFSNVKLLQNGVGGSWWDVVNITCVGFSNMGVTLQLEMEKNLEVSVPYYLIMPESGYIKMSAEI